MYHFFVEGNQISQNEIIIEGKDVNHIKNVLRLSVGTDLVLCDKEGMDYNCVIEALTEDDIRCRILNKGKSKAELPVWITLVQGAPKGDKMELIVQKTVELGVSDIRPVIMKRSIVKYDQKKARKKSSRWQSIAESAAKQSKRGIIPKLLDLMPWKLLLTELSNYDKVIIPYENQNGMIGTRDTLSSLKAGERIALVIGPEGGFDESEIEDLRAIGGETISLGNRILRTETAGLASLAMISYQLEEV